MTGRLPATPIPVFREATRGRTSPDPTSPIFVGPLQDAGKGPTDLVPRAILREHAVHGRVKPLPEVYDERLRELVRGASGHNVRGDTFYGRKLSRMLIAIDDDNRGLVAASGLKRHPTATVGRRKVGRPGLDLGEHAPGKARFARARSTPPAHAYRSGLTPINTASSSHFQ